MRALYLSGGCSNIVSYTLLFMQSTVRCKYTAVKGVYFARLQWRLKTALINSLFRSCKQYIYLLINIYLINLINNNFLIILNYPERQLYNSVAYELVITYFLPILINSL